jgi:hypothetical protein
MKVRLVRSSDVGRDLLEKVYNLLIQEDGPTQFTKEEHSISFHDEETPLSWHIIFDRCATYRSRYEIPSDDFLILLTSKSNELNWFSSLDPDGRRSIFIHTAEWDNYLIDCEPYYPIAHQCWSNLLHALMFRSLDDASHLWHDPPIGCVTDLCSWKPDITYKLRAADVCGACLSVLAEREAPINLIKQALSTFDVLRKHMLFSRQIRDIESHDDKLPFPVAITRRKLTTTTEPLRKFLLLIDHFDSLVRTAVLFLGAAALRNDLANFLRDKRLHERPSLGDWVKALQSLRDHAHGLVALPEDLATRIQTVVSAAEQTNIVRLRNERRGHGYVDCYDLGYREEYAACSPIVADIESLLTPVLARLNCYHVINTDRKKANEFEVTVKSMMGSHPDFAAKSFCYEPKKVENIPYKDQCYLYIQNDAQWIALHPYVQFKDCPLCRHPRVLIADGQQYLDPYAGHRVDLPPE